MEKGVQVNHKGDGDSEKGRGSQKKPKEKLYNTKVGFNLVGGRKFY